MKRYCLWRVFGALFLFPHQGRAQSSPDPDQAKVTSTLTNKPKDIGKQIKVEGNTYLDVPDKEAIALEIEIWKGLEKYKVLNKMWEIPTPGETANYSCESETNLDAGTYVVVVTFTFKDANDDIRQIEIKKTVVVQ